MYQFPESPFVTDARAAWEEVVDAINEGNRVRQLRLALDSARDERDAAEIALDDARDHSYADAIYGGPVDDAQDRYELALGTFDDALDEYADAFAAFGGEDDL